MNITYEGFLWTSIFMLIICLLLQYVKRSARTRELINKLPGPPSWPIIGNAFDLAVDHAEVLNVICKFTKTGPKLCRVWLGPSAWIILYHADSAEVILASNTHIDKSHGYSFMEPFVGTGLISSGGSKWRSRRKLLNPAFHYRMLEDFIATFNEQSQVLVNKLSNIRENTVFDVFPLVTLCALDIICESMMGCSVNAQECGHSPYVKAIERIKKIIHARQITIYLQPDWLFQRLPIGKEQAQCLQILHSFTKKVIQNRKEERLKRQTLTQQESTLGRKKRLAFLDLLIEASDGGQKLSDLDIQEEVDTFMVAGHDTTAAGITWALYLLGSNPDVQQKVYEEITEICGNDKTKNVSFEDLNKFKYLERVIKETLRLFPPVPIFVRLLKEDTVIEGYTIPAGTTAAIFPYIIHRDPDVFPDPEKFDPDRFLKENTLNRNPYAYFSFSAGPRNCIGQKFGMLEMKVVLIHILRSFIVESVQKLEDIQLIMEIVLGSRNGIKLRLKPR